MAMSFMDGNEAIAHASIEAGCRFFAGYPITPATTIYQHMLTLLPAYGGICLQGEDEIASIGFCLGASMAGFKALTATSGPGISLYSEQISFAIGGEIPLVIVDVQRLGPSTGSATKGADGDIQFLRWGNSGGLPVIVLAPVDVRDCYTLTLHAFNLSEQFRCPVFIASNKEIAMTRESIELDALDSVKVLSRSQNSQDMPYKPFQVSNQSLTPPFLPIGGKQLVRQTSSTHGPDGYITVDTEIIRGSITRLHKKLSDAVDQFSLYEIDLDNDAEILLITYGVTSRSARTAMQQIRSTGKKISLLILKTLYPVPKALIKRFMDHVTTIVVVEMNLGLYVREIERLAKTQRIIRYGQMDGELLRPDKIREVVGL
ncbi:MAG: pyruvate flavodoxin/ferredoxin oxidoreductase [Deltaproteobacteria bacterium]|nr:pyruvate flavodoxin/ferredoxin oxidoreductase [Deltaproteobacteria bacterium]